MLLYVPELILVNPWDWRECWGIFVGKSGKSQHWLVARGSNLRTYWVAKCPFIGNNTKLGAPNNVVRDTLSQL